MSLNGLTLLPFGGLSLLADAVVFAFACLNLYFICEHWRDKA